MPAFVFCCYCDKSRVFVSGKGVKMVQQDREVKITFEPTGRSVWILRGTSVSEAAGRCGLSIDSPCGGVGTCGKCRVRFISGIPAAGQADCEILDEAEIQAGWRLACQTTVTRDAVIAIPETSLFAEQLQILTDSSEVVEISAEDLPSKTATCPITLRDGERNFAIAFDLGTTTLVGELLELPSGSERAIAAGINPQVSFGDDVVSRIGRACQGASQAQEMRDVIIEAINKLVDELCEKTSIGRDEVRGLSFAGNTTMQHLLCGLDVSSLAQLPFTPASKESYEADATEFGIPAGPGAKVYVMPVIGGFVGGDTVAGLLATRMGQADGPVLMIDIGTNGEIVLARGGELLAASAAAGPAFEGARISCGMRAAAGAIEKVVLAEGLLKFSVIGGVEPIGICGSALVDIAAEMLRCGVMDSVGRIVTNEDLPDTACEELRQRLRADEKGQPEFLLTSGNGSPDVTITQRDIRELQLATGALRAGVGILLKQAGLQARDLQQVLIAGGFGSFIRRANAQRIGLIPTKVPAERISYVGNVSLHGAKWVLVSSAARKSARDLAGRVRHVELSADLDFQMAFADAMIFPEN